MISSQYECTKTQKVVITIFRSVCNNKEELFLSHLRVQIFTSSIHGTGRGDGMEAASYPLCKEQWRVTSWVLQFCTDCQRQLFHSFLCTYAQISFALSTPDTIPHTNHLHCVCVKMQFPYRFSSAFHLHQACQVCKMFLDHFYNSSTLWFRTHSNKEKFT